MFRARDPIGIKILGIDPSLPLEMLKILAKKSHLTENLLIVLLLLHRYKVGIRMYDAAYDGRN